MLYIYIYLYYFILYYNTWTESIDLNPRFGVAHGWWRWFSQLKNKESPMNSVIKHFFAVDVPSNPLMFPKNQPKKAKHINNSDKCWTSGMVMEGGRERERERERTAIQWWGFWGYSGIDLPKYDAELQRVWGLEDDFPHFGHCCFWVDDMAIKMSSVRKLNPVFLAGTEGD